MGKSVSKSSLRMFYVLSLIKKGWLSMVCFKCGKPAKFSVLMASDGERWFVPTQGPRSKDAPPLIEVWLCEEDAVFLDDLVGAYLPPAPRYPHQEDLPAGLSSQRRDDLN